MKISKAGILTLGVMFLIGSMGLVLVNAEEPEDPEETEELEVNIYIDPSNAIQHIQEVHFVSTGGNTRTAKMKMKDNRLVGIETSIDFILSKTGDDINTISSQSGYNSILGGIKNKILGGSKYSVILAGLGNIITGKHNTIIGGKNNSILGESSTILGGSSNYVTGDYSVTVGSKNHITGDYSVTVGSDNIIKGDNSVVMGVNTEIKADNSFLLNLKSGSGLHTFHEKLNVTNLNNVFLINSDSGVVINSDKAHSFSKLTLGGSLSIFSNSDDENIQCGSGKGGGIIKAVNTNVGQMCLCSCDGSGWNSMLARGTCVGACEQPKKPECGDTVERVCSDEGGFTYLGSCNTGSFPIEGEGSYLVDKYDKVHWSCQTEDGSIVFCSGGISNVVNECAHRCEGNLPNNAIANGRQITDRAGVEYFYDPTGTGDCSYKCMSGFNYVIEDGEELCVKCKDGTYNTGSRTCEHEAFCEEPFAPFSGGCVKLGNCIEQAAILDVSVTEQWLGNMGSLEWYNRGKEVFKPYGAQTELPWKCKSSSGNVNPRSCEFSCKPGYSCSYWTGANGKNGDYCISNTKVGCYGLSSLYGPDETAFINFPELGWIKWHHPVGSGTVGNNNAYQKFQFVDSLEEFNNLKDSYATGCYSFCDLGFHKSQPDIGNCVSNCREMRLGGKNKYGIPGDLHNWDERQSTYPHATGWFHNGRFEQEKKPRTGGGLMPVLTEWTYVSPLELDANVANNTGKCLWTCRSGIPIPNVNKVSPFKEELTNFHYISYIEYDTCWEECPSNYYFSGFRCLKVSTNEYIPDPLKVITYLGITNSIAQRKACDTGQTYLSGTCVLDRHQQQCLDEGYEYVNGKCIACPYGYGFTGDNYTCAPYDRCDLNQDWSVDTGDSLYITNYILYGNNAYDAWLDIDKNGVLTITDVTNSAEMCVFSFDECDVNRDFIVDDADVELLKMCIEENDPGLGWCDVNRDNQVDSADLEYFKEGGECYLG